MPNGWRRLPALAALAGAALLAAGCSSSLAADPAAPGGAIIAIGAENEYADVIQQVGGKYVQASARTSGAIAARALNTLRMTRRSPSVSPAVCRTVPPLLIMIMIPNFVCNTIRR